jgi:pimeloyl-ACP methyl ester carboxylesterase
MAAPVSFEVLPPGTQVEHLPFTSEDGALSLGFLYHMGNERRVICMTHPRGGLERHYMIPTMLESGFAVFTFNHRMRTDDFDLVHETLLLDIAGAIRFMKSERVYEEVVLFGNSGGGGPLGYYQWQAETSQPNRFTHTPGGDSLDLNTFDLPAAQGFILLAAGFGESVHVSRWIDPSVIDESDPLSCDPELDMYSSTNGYKEPPASSTYSQEFRQQYRAAQQARVARIDAYARSLIEEQCRYQQQMHEPGFSGLPLDERSYIARRASDHKDVRVYRLTAALENADLSIYPSRRTTGSFLTLDTHVTNYRNAGTLGWRRTPRAWLSATSGLSSRCSLRQALPHIQVPTLVIGYTADRGIYPDDLEEMVAISAANDKALHHVDGDHFGFPIEGSSESSPRLTVSHHMAAWLRDRFPGS